MATDRRLFLRAFPALAAAAPNALAATRPTQGSFEADLAAEIDRIPLVNTHEHIIPEQERTSSRTDFFTLAGHYAINDVISAGLGGDDLELVRDAEAPMARRWAAFEPHWRHARFTGYSEALRVAIRDIYGVEEISGATLATINERMAEKNKPGLYAEILERRANIAYSVLDDYWNAAPVAPDARFFALARKFDRYVAPQSAKALQALEALTDVSIASLADLKRAMERSFEQSLEAGMVCVKSTLAYSREIRYEEVSASDASRDMEDLLRDARALPEGFRSRAVRPYRALEDHMFHHLISLANERNVPVQIHTGLHAGNGNYIQNSNPAHLTNLFFLFPRVRFDLFHLSYPYTGELSTLAKTFPNVHVDFCWAHIISPSAARRALHELLETVPANKLFGFGGDYRYPELSYAHAKIARRNITQVLAEKTAAGFCSQDQARELARLILHDGPNALFGWRRV